MRQIGDKNKFKKILAIIKSNKFNHKYKIGKFRYNDIKDLVDNINKNTVSQILARKTLNALNEIKKAEIKNKRLISGQKKLLNFFNNLLDTILTENNNNNNNNNEEDGNEDENEDDDNEDENEDKNEEYCIIKQINGYFKMIDESISFEEQTNLLKKINFLYEYWSMGYYDDDKELNLKIFKLTFAYISNAIDEKFFEEIFGHTFVTLANKLINTTNKEENGIIINNIKKNVDQF